jgi:hypothetical protein
MTDFLFWKWSPRVFGVLSPIYLPISATVQLIFYWADHDFVLRKFG